MYKVGFIGNLVSTIEFINFNSEFELKFICVEKDRATDQLLTVSLVRNIPFITLDSTDKLRDITRSNDVDFIIMSSFGRKINPENISCPVYNIHFSGLPKYKGRHPTFSATMAGEKFLGISIHIVTSNIDEGDIIHQQFVPYYIWENENDVFKKLEAQIPILLENLTTYLKNKKDYRLTINDSRSYFKPAQLQDYTLNLQEDSPTALFNKIRSQFKNRGAYFKSKNGTSLWVKDALFSKLSPQEQLKDDFVYKDGNIVGLSYKDQQFLRLLDYTMESK